MGRKELIENPAWHFPRVDFFSSKGDGNEKKRLISLQKRATEMRDEELERESELWLFCGLT